MKNLNREDMLLIKTLLSDCECQQSIIRQSKLLIKL